jgi:hypothetical protein
MLEFMAVVGTPKTQNAAALAGFAIGIAKCTSEAGDAFSCRLHIKDVQLGGVASGFRR